MPGFQIGGSTGQPANTVETRRKHRWVFRSIGGNEVSPDILLLLQSCSRPHASFEEAELHHLEEKAYFAGKYSWEAITMTFYDAHPTPDVSKGIWDWFNKVITVKTAAVAPPSEYKKDAKLEMVDGTGTNPIEKWTMIGCWPQDVNWSDLDYTSTEIQKVEVIMRYDRAERESS